MDNVYVVIRDMSAGNAETGEAWQETKIFHGSATLNEVMLWANPEYDYKTKQNELPNYSKKRIVLTKPH